MAHYDCSNCGAHMGIGFGYCRECTPKEYRELDSLHKSEFNRIYNDIMERHKEYARNMARIYTQELRIKLEKLKEEYKKQGIIR